MAGDKSSEGEKTISAGTLIIMADVSDALKGLKAVQREAKKGTAALKELEEQQKRNNTLSGYSPHTVVFDEMHTMCPLCGNPNTEERRTIARGTELVCLSCGWADNK
ncbi:hypothetical protein [Virgibacillus litoralis]|uniref:Uncharacterized protein n=1 Tax=Virgibacillus litoralis TaxID=578221 RepID=A0ABS4HIQ2_9BACI|nr:hypothetical protein [Virgibacillus litoralis]MBP1950282.1 hypothetical protein [Virgibacillus litoralis]